MLNMFQLYINFNAIPIYKAGSVLTERKCDFIPLV